MFQQFLTFFNFSFFKKNLCKTFFHLFCMFFKWIFAPLAVSWLTLKIVISVLPSNRSRVLDLACPNTQSSLVLDSPQESTDACAAVVSHPERSSGRLSRPGSPRVCLTRPGLAVEQCVSRLLQLSCHPASTFKLRHPFVLNFSSICLFNSVLLRAVSSRPCCYASSCAE